MTGRTYLRPTGFVDAPFGHDGKVARLAGGLVFFASVDIVRDEGVELVPVQGIEDRLDDAERLVWERLTAPRAALQLGERVVRLDQPQVMGIVNVTPDSFSDGGVHEETEAAVTAGHDMAAAGAAIVDVGGESTRPGARPVWEGDEAARVLPVIRRLAMAGTAVSVDTRKALVMEQAVGAGARMINDVSGLTWDPRALEVVARAGCPVVLMHHKGPPESMQDDPRYDRPVLLEIYDWLEARIQAAEAAGIARERIIVDPGFGFGKNVQHNLQLMNGLALLHGLGCPVMLGASRKRTIGALAGEAPPDRRLAGSLAFALQAAGQGVQLLRVHDVPETLQALRVWRGSRDAALTPNL
ncbi:MAG TPA: dihydropteroate synthase [Allosphingosinicella sp.]|nr:dihydropteroate synthase [Allosphingosinicella sp.]